MLVEREKQRAFAVEVVERLRAAGFVALWAGGCVRDQLLGVAPKDYDVATSALPDQVRDVAAALILVDLLQVIGGIPPGRLQSHELNLSRHLDRPLDVAGLGSLVTAAEQDHHRVAALGEIHPVAGTVVDPHFRHAAAGRDDRPKPRPRA